MGYRGCCGCRGGSGIGIIWICFLVIEGRMYDTLIIYGVKKAAREQADM